MAVLSNAVQPCDANLPADIVPLLWLPVKETRMTCRDRRSRSIPQRSDPGRCSAPHCCNRHTLMHRWTQASEYDRDIVHDPSICSLDTTLSTLIGIQPRLIPGVDQNLPLLAATVYHMYLAPRTYHLSVIFNRATADPDRPRSCSEYIM